MPEPSPTKPPPSAFDAGRLIADRYRLEHRIASGGMAEVWQARDEVLGRFVAVKILHPHLAADDTFVARFRTEAIAAARLHHPGIVGIYDTCNDRGAEAIVMELVRGTTLRAELDRRGFLEAGEVAAIGAQVADALAAAHRAGLVHRDIKPANILICEDRRVMVTDFGIAKIRDDPDLTQTGTMLGTVKYLAPEQVRGERLDGRADIYALGVVMYEALCSRAPFTGDNPASTALARLHHTPPRPRQQRATVPIGLDAIVMRCLKVDPDERYATAGELRAALLEPGATRDDDLTVHGADRTTSWSPTAAAPGRAGGAGGPGGPGRPTSVAAPTSPAPSPAVVDDVAPAGWVRPLAVTLFVLGAIVLAGVLIARTDLGRSALDWARRSTESTGDANARTGAGTPAVLPVSTVRSFDPQGRGTPGENDAQLARAVDGDPGTGWFTESYDQRDFGIKQGVGIVVQLERAASLHDLTVSSPTQDWAASVYVADEPGASLDDWGAPVDQRSDIRGDVTFDLNGAHGSAVLLWITDLGDAPPRVRAEIDEITVRG